MKVTDGELEWLEKDVDELISAERAPDMVTFLVKTREELAQVRAAIAKKVIKNFYPSLHIVNFLETKLLCNYKCLPYV